MKLIQLPIRYAKIVLRHPTATVGVSLLCITTAFFVALQLSPAAQKHFNAAMESFGYSTVSMILSSTADAALSASNATSRQLARELDNSKRKIATLEQEVGSRQKRLNQIDAFQKKANKIVKKHDVRLTKAIIKTATGEVMAWVPVVGDVASMYFAVDGTIELCKMFKELEDTALEYGLPFHMYSGTFCDDPIGKSKAILMETSQDITKSVTKSLQQQSENRTDYWSDKIEKAVKFWRSW